MPRLNERYAELCADAAQHSSAKVVYEFMPFDVNVNSVDLALEVMDGIDNTGVVIDTWHMGKLGITPDDLRKIPVEQPRLGRALRRPVRGHGGPRSTRSSTAASCPARASSTSAAT